MWTASALDLKTIGQCVLKLLARNQFCDVDDADDDTDADDGDGQSNPYVSAMLRRQHNKNKMCSLNTYAPRMPAKS